jgi:uncharacterized protein
MTQQIERVAVMGYLAQNIRTILGRTVLMKLCYFLQELRGVWLGYSFSLYSYGPFDSAVLSDLGEGEALGVLREVIVYYPSSYGYRITCEMDPETLADLGGELLQDHRGDIDWVIEEFGNFTAANLELASTLIYADREAHTADEEISIAELTRRVQEVKPRFSNDHILRQAEYLSRKNLLLAVS